MDYSPLIYSLSIAFVTGYLDVVVRSEVVCAQSEVRKAGFSGFGAKEKGRKEERTLALHWLMACERGFWGIQRTEC